MKISNKTQDGYIAIVTTIIISLVLLTLIAENSFLGWRARFMVIARERKHQANILTDGCASIALASLLKDPAFASSSAAVLGGNCHMQITNAGDPRAIELHVRSFVGSPNTGGVAVAAVDVIADVVSGRILSRKEIPTSE